MAVDERARPCCPFSHRTRPPEIEKPCSLTSKLQRPRDYTNSSSSFPVMSATKTPVAEINLQPCRSHGYNAYVPVRLGELNINAFVNSGNTYANVISPQTMADLGIEMSQLEPSSLWEEWRSALFR